MPEQQQALETNQRAEGRKDVKQTEVQVIARPQGLIEPPSWLPMFPDKFHEKLSKCHGVARSEFSDTTVIDMPGDHQPLCFSDKERVAKHV